VLEDFDGVDQALIQSDRHPAKAVDFGFNHAAGTRQVVHGPSQAENRALGKHGGDPGIPACSSISQFS
jgi:hypothetical protein